MSLALRLEPQDLLFCRDGRPIVAGEGAAAGSSLPSPQVLAGAIRTFVLRQRGELKEGKASDEAIQKVLNIRVRGPILMDKDGPLIPMPADVVGEKSKHGSEAKHLARLRPWPDFPGWIAPPNIPKAQALWTNHLVPDGQNNKHRPGELSPQTGFLTWKGFEKWLRGETPGKDDLKHQSDLWETEVRTQVALKPDTATAEDGKLLSTHYLRLKKDISLYAEVEGADELPKDFLLGLGGDRRQVRVSQTKQVFNNLPKPAQKACALAITPTILESGLNCPVNWQSMCTGLAINGADPISGWDLAKSCPKPVRWAIRAGAVWFFDQAATNSNCIGIETENGFGWTVWGKPSAH